jgi:hypothetical protein
MKHKANNNADGMLVRSPANPPVSRALLCVLLHTILIG